MVTIGLTSGISSLQEAVDVLLVGVSLAVAAVPEGLPAILSVVLSFAVGLGLAIVNKIVEEHGGEIAFLDRPGGGTHVRIAFDKARLATLAAASDGEDDRTPDQVDTPGRRADDPDHQST